MNVTVPETRPDFMQINTIVDTIKDAKHKLGNRGRVLVRYSGTQPLLRVMVEGPDQELIERYCSDICNSIKQNLA